MWNLITTILISLGAAGGIIASVVLCARLWSGAARERLITFLDAELKINREHVVRADADVAKYRQDMHDTRNECGAKISKSLLEADSLKESLKKVELENVSLQTRPDLTSISALLTSQAKTMESLDTSMKKHGESDALVFNKIIEKLDQYAVKSDERMAMVLVPVQLMCKEVTAALRQGAKK